MRRIARRWREMLSIVGGILVVVVLPSHVPERDQLVEASGVVRAKQFKVSVDGKSRTVKLRFFVGKHEYKVIVKPEFVHGKIKNGTKVRVLWDPQNSISRRNVAEMWIGTKQIFSFELYKEVTTSWNILYIVLGTGFALFGIIRWYYHEKSAMEAE